MPMFSTPAFSETCSPSPASSKGMPAATAPAISEIRKASLSRPCDMAAQSRAAICRRWPSHSVSARKISISATSTRMK